MLEFDAILPYVPAFAVVLSRVLGIFMLTPLLSSSSVPVQIRAVFAVSLTVALFPVVDISPVLGVEYDLIDLIPLIATETLVGLCIGVLATIPLMSVQLGGLLMGQQMGLGMAQVVNPGTDIEGDNLGQILFIVAVGTFLLMGGLEALIGGLIVSFDRVPVGSFALDDMPLSVLVGLITSGFEMALRVATPIIAIIFVENVAMGFLMKTVPTLNIMSFGFPIRILVGLGALVLCLTAIGAVIGDEIMFALVTMEEWLAGLGSD